MTTLQRGLTREQRQRLWQMWKTGSSITDIGISLSKAPGSVHTYLSHRGGIAPPSRQRAERHLSLAQREEISRGLVLGSSLRSIALLIGVAPSTVTREVKRNGGGSVYRAVTADARASTQACRPKTCKLASHLPLREAVANKLQQDWSPQQVSGWLQKFYGDDSSMQLSHEAIYRSLFIQTRGLLKRELLAHLRSRRMMRRSQAFSTKGRPRGQIIDAVSIHDRPASVEDRAIPGHWEGDLITGSCNSHIATLVERHSRFVVLVKLKGKDTTSVVDALTAQVQELPKELMRTLTWDRGSELAQHKRFTLATNVQVYFCDPRSPWQRGSNGACPEFCVNGADIKYRRGDLRTRW